MKNYPVRMHGRVINLDTNTAFARRALHRKFTARGIPLKTIVFGKIRKDGTRNVKIETLDGRIQSWSYLTDIV